MVISVEIKNLDRIEQLIRAMPKEAEKELRKAVNKAEDAAHREALIQIHQGLYGQNGSYCQRSLLE